MKLPDHIIRMYFMDIVETVNQMIIDNPKIEIIDIDVIEDHLYETKYKQMFIDLGLYNDEL